MGGELHQCSTVGFQAGRRQAHCNLFYFILRGVKCGACCEVCWSGPTSFGNLPRMPVEDLCRRFRVSLVCLYAGGAKADECFPPCSFGWNFCVARFACVPCAIVSLHEEADPHTMSKFFVVCESASCVCDTSAKGSRRKARRKTVREYRYTHRTRPALIAGQFVRAALYLCGLLLTRSPAPRRDDVRPLEKETMRFPKNRRRRGGLARPAVCTVPAACRSVAFPLVASAQGITN